MFLEIGKIYTKDDNPFLRCDVDYQIPCEGFCKVDFIEGIEKSSCYELYRLDNCESFKYFEIVVFIIFHQQNLFLFFQTKSTFSTCYELKTILFE